jgi:hypothetical protein
MARAPVSLRSKHLSLWARTRAPLRRRCAVVTTGGGDAGRGGGSGLDAKLELLLLLLLLLLPAPLFFFSTCATNSVQHIPRYRDNCSSSKSIRCMQLRTSSKPHRLPALPRLDLSNCTGNYDIASVLAVRYTYPHCNTQLFKFTTLGRHSTLSFNSFPYTVECLTTDHNSGKVRIFNFTECSSVNHKTRQGS